MINHVKENTVESKERPLVTFALFAYNQEQYIREALEGALAQTYSPLEIILSDDCSTDRTFQIMQQAIETYCGPHILKINRNQKNLGLVEHINKLFDLSSGSLFVVAAGDDVSLPNRVMRLMEVHDSSGRDNLLIHSSAIKIDQAGKELGLFIPPVTGRSLSIEDMALSHSIYIGATGAWGRSLYGEFGPIVCINAYEDLVLGFRAGLKDSLRYVSEPLVKYRYGTGVTTQADIPLIKIAKRKALRQRWLLAVLDVYRQRLIDLDLVDINKSLAAVRERLIKEIDHKQGQLLFYRNPFSLLLGVFSRDYIKVIRAFGYEIKYLFRLFR